MNKLRLKQLQVGDTTLTYRIVRKPNKHTYLAIKGDVVEIRANHRVSEAQIIQLIHDKADWILTRLQTDRAEAALADNEAWLWGERVPIRYDDRTEIVLDELLVLPHNAKSHLQAILIAWYRLHTQVYLDTHLPKFAEQMQLSPTKVSVRHTTSRWGSCSSRNALSFSLLSAQLPKSVVDYLIVHELAHIRHKHHQASFWALVTEFCPNVDAERKKLREFESRILQLK